MQPSRPAGAEPCKDVPACGKGILCLQTYFKTTDLYTNANLFLYCKALRNVASNLTAYANCTALNTTQFGPIYRYPAHSLPNRYLNGTNFSQIQGFVLANVCPAVPTTECPGFYLLLYLFHYKNRLVFRAAVTVLLFITSVRRGFMSDNDDIIIFILLEAEDLLNYLADEQKSEFLKVYMCCYSMCKIQNELFVLSDQQ